MTDSKTANEENSGSDDLSRLDRPPYVSTPEFEGDYHGFCFCRAIRFTLRGPPKANCFCHCRSCQRLHGAPATLTSIYEKDNVRFTHGRQDMVFYSPQEKKTEYKLPLKISCKHCHSPVANEGNHMILASPKAFIICRINSDRCCLR